MFARTYIDPFATLSQSPFLLFLFVLWAALRFGVRGTSAVTVLVCLIAALGTAHGTGVFHAREQSEASLVVLSMFCVVLAITGLLAASVNAHRSREYALARDRALLDQILDGLPVGVWTSDPNGVIQSGNPAAARIWGRPLAAGSAGFQSLKAWRVKDGTPVEPQECPMSLVVKRGERTEQEMFEVETFDGARRMSRTF